MAVGTKLLAIFGVDTSSALFGGERWVSLGLMLFLVTVSYLELEHVADGLGTDTYLIALGPLLLGALVAAFMSAYVYELQEVGTGKIQRVLGGFWLSPVGRAAESQPDSHRRSHHRFSGLTPADLWTRQSRALSYVTSCMGIALLGWGIGGSAALVGINAFADVDQPSSILSSQDDAEHPGPRADRRNRHRGAPPPLELPEQPPEGSAGVDDPRGPTEDPTLEDNQEGTVSKHEPTAIVPEIAPPNVKLVAPVHNVHLGVGESLRIPLRIWVDGKKGWYPVEWRSKSPNTATVHAGLVTGRTTGSTQMVARSGSARAVVRIHVSPQGSGVGISEVQSIEIANDNPTVIHPGQKIRLEALVIVDGESGLYHPLSWTSSSGATVAVDDTGVVEGLAVGRAQVTATAGSLDDTVRIEVHPREEDLAALARQCANGGGVDPCFREAYWLELLNRYRDASRRFVSLCERGHGKSCWHLARLYQQGRGEGATLERAQTLFDRACQLGHTRACR